MVESAVGKGITYNTGLPTGRVQFDITGDPGEALSNTTIATITVAILDTVGSNKGGNCAEIHQSSSDGDGTYITSSDVDIYSATSTSYGVKTDYAKISVTSSNVIINCTTGSLKSESASNISVTNCNLIEAKITSGGALVSSPNINSISSYVYIRLVKPGTVIENNYALVYDSGNGIYGNALEGTDTNILKLNNANVTITLTE